MCKGEGGGVQAPIKVGHTDGRGLCVRVWRGIMGFRAAHVRARVRVREHTWCSETSMPTHEIYMPTHVQK